MSRGEVIAGIKEIIQATFKNEVNLEQIQEDTDLINELGFNSINSIEILVRCESEFNIEIDDEDLSMDLLKTLGAFADYIQNKLN